MTTAAITYLGGCTFIGFLLAFVRPRGRRNLPFLVAARADE